MGNPMYLILFARHGYCLQKKNGCGRPVAAVALLIRLAILKTDHGADRQGAANIRNIKTLDTPWHVAQVEFTA